MLLCPNYDCFHRCKNDKSEQPPLIMKKRYFQPSNELEHSESKTAFYRWPHVLIILSTITVDSADLGLISTSLTSLSSNYYQ
ncbi:hypothetical protein DFA_04182 [Cavenderia fasciculata]|uniref:Uncharacterized protein n=1 Tax=Cavenderia fasciculata TaxID=261658 RepID=F4Q1I5_CACFS|nr:uncharacterized protein DFA_04182 [Cavenderia fasciculata]EGG18686.1 hypothetical protein DFA_04182 [Cavenderia fasciculata]|eukprot:XP_004366590.1 hypothetical protein DFA_04182 [Cavenderia fasciculata]